MGTKPKYEEIKDQLIEAIRLQKYKPGSELPSENELIAEYNVSRITVRRAMTSFIVPAISKSIRESGATSRNLRGFRN